MRRLSATLFFILALSAVSFRPAQELPVPPDPPAQQVKWLSWEEAMELSQKEKKKIFLDVYTDWCGWCKRMDQNTFQQPEIARYLNEHFYPVKLNAEYRGELKYQGKVYEYTKNGARGYHELAAKLLRGRLSFPTVVFLDEDQQVIQSIVGYKSPEQFELIATYFGSDEYKKTPWSVYQRNFKSTIGEKK